MFQSRTCLQQRAPAAALSVQWQHNGSTWRHGQCNDTANELRYSYRKSRPTSCSPMSQISPITSGSSFAAPFSASISSVKTASSRRGPFNSRASLAACLHCLLWGGVYGGRKYFCVAHRNTNRKETEGWWKQNRRTHTPHTRTEPAADKQSNKCVSHHSVGGWRTQRTQNTIIVCVL